jgi:hypothetical protein
MKQIICDLCGTIADHPKSIPIPCHLWTFNYKGGYVDSNGNDTSGRHDHLDACTPCWNKCFGAMADKAREIKKENNMPSTP